MTLTDRQIKNIAKREGVSGDELVDLVRRWEADGAAMGKTAVENLAWELRRGEAPVPNPHDFGLTRDSGRQNPHGSFAGMGGYREQPARRTGLTKKGERMVREIEADSPYGPDAPGIAYATVYARAKDRPGTGLVTKEWAREHGYPRPNPEGYADPFAIDWDDILEDRWKAGIEVIDTLNDRVIQQPRFDRRTFEVYVDKYKHPRYVVQVLDFTRPRDQEIVVDNQGRDGGWRVMKANPASADPAAVSELALYIENDGDIYRQHTMPVFRNLSRKWKKGSFDRSLAPKAFSYVVEAGAKKYVRDFGGGVWHRVFPKPVRDEVAQMMADEFIQEAELGNLSE